MSALENHVLESEDGWQEAVRLCRRQARAVLGPGPAAEDVAQEAALRAWRHRARCHDPQQPWAWVASIARREALREAGRPMALSLDELPEVPANAATGAEERLVIREALGRLLPADRAFLLERYVLERTSAEIGKAHGLSAGAVRVRLHRSRIHMRGLLEGSADAGTGRSELHQGDEPPDPGPDPRHAR